MDLEDKEQGPLSKRQLYQAWQSQILDKSCWVWNKSMKEWAQITALEDLYTYLRTPQLLLPSSPQPPPSPTSSSGLLYNPSQPTSFPIPILTSAMSAPLPLSTPQPTSMGMMPSVHVPMEQMAISPTPKKSWFSNWSSRQGPSDNRKRLIDPGDSDSEARKELEYEQYNATRVHLIYSAVWLLSTTGLIFALGILGQGWFPVFGYMAIAYNVITFLIVWYDKILEFRRSNVRVSEWLIFLYMWWAGFVGAWLSLLCFSHKYQNVAFTAKGIACTILNLFWIAIYVNSLGLDSSDDDGGSD